ncbi:MAG TPA: CAP domain-containing protein [Anaerolineae bacterium]|nr:CAP domain-containing protein [Anaerolineae bacterium]
MIQSHHLRKLHWLMAFTVLASIFLFDRAVAVSPNVITSSITRSPNSTPPYAPDFSGCGGIIQPVVNADYEQQVLDLVNTERANNGLPPYKRATELDNAARYHSADMGQDNYFSHDTYDRSGGNLVFVCDTWARLATYYPSTGWRGENIAAGYSTPQDVMNGWMNSSGHRANILSSNYWEIGIGYATASGSSYYRYWTQDFGQRSGVYPLIINRDAASTDSRHVALYIYGSFQQMRLKNDNGAWSDWQTFQNNVAWIIANGVGTHTVTAELKSGSTVITSSDTIYLTVAGVPQLGDLPDTLTFLYSIPQSRLTPTSMTFIPIDVNTNDPITWTLTQTGTWFTATPASGTWPQAFQITPGTFMTNTPTIYTGSLTVTVTDPAETLGSPQRIDLTLRVIDTPLYDVYLPLINH